MTRPMQVSVQAQKIDQQAFEPQREKSCVDFLHVFRVSSFSGWVHLQSWDKLIYYKREEKSCKSKTETTFFLSQVLFQTNVLKLKNAVGGHVHERSAFPSGSGRNV